MIASCGIWLARFPVIEKIAGSQMDPEVVRAFRAVAGVGKIPAVTSDLASLAEAVGAAHRV